jgi:hypothetical protein
VALLRLACLIERSVGDLGGTEHDGAGDCEGGCPPARGLVQGTCPDGDPDQHASTTPSAMALLRLPADADANVTTPAIPAIATPGAKGAVA